MLIANREDKSINVISVNENGEEVFAAHANYSDRSIYVSFEMLNGQYCAENKHEVEGAVSAFLGRLNEVLALDGLIQVKS